MPLTETQKHYFDIIDTEEKAYILGFICGDGYIDTNRGCVRIDLSMDDRKHLEKLAKIFNITVKDYIGPKTSLRKQRKESRIVIQSRILCNHLVDVKGLTRHKTTDLNETIFEHVPDNLQSHFIRGIFDADGSIFFVEGDTPRMSITGTERMLKKIRELIINSCGVSKNKQLEYRKGCFVYVLTGKNQLLPIRDWLYKDATIFLERKKERFFSIILKDKKHPYKGISKKSTSTKWCANINIDKKTVFLGSFLTAIEAAKAYDDAAKKLNYPPYKLNFGNIC